jgi:hypothetical protein
MNAQPHGASIFFERGIEALRPAFAMRGFTYVPGVRATASGGPFTTAFFRKGDLEIGLIVRNTNQLGCPNYSIGRGYAGHEDVAHALGYSGTQQLIAGQHLEYVARDGGDPFAALSADLDTLIFPAFDQSEKAFHSIIDAAVRRVRDVRGW